MTKKKANRIANFLLLVLLGAMAALFYIAWPSHQSLGSQLALAFGLLLATVVGSFIFFTWDTDHPHSRKGPHRKM